MFLRNRWEYWILNSVFSVKAGKEISLRFETYWKIVQTKKSLKDRIWTMVQDTFKELIRSRCEREERDQRRD